MPLTTTNRMTKIVSSTPLTLSNMSGPHLPVDEQRDENADHDRRHLVPVEERDVADRRVDGVVDRREQRQHERHQQQPVDRVMVRAPGPGSGIGDAPAALLGTVGVGRGHGSLLRSWTVCRGGYSPMSRYRTPVRGPNPRSGAAPRGVVRPAGSVAVVVAVVAAGATLLLAGDREALVDLDRDLGAVGLGDVGLVHAVAVGLDPDEGRAGVLREYGCLDLLGRAAGQQRLVGALRLAGVAGV